MKDRYIKIISSVLLFFSTVSFAGTEVLKNEAPPKENLQVKEEIHNVVIIGGGVGALTSGVYLARAGFSPLIIEGKTPGGLITQSHLVENWPGEFQISGSQLAEKLKSQASKNGCNIISKEVIDVDFSKKPYVITVKDLIKNDQIEKIYANSCIIAMGTSSNYLNVEGEKEFWGKGVSNCAVCDGALYKNKDVAIIGGGDSAIIEASYLSNIAKSVKLIVRKDSLKASDKAKINSILQKDNVKVLYKTQVVSINGEKDNVKSITVFDDEKKQKYNLDVDGVFLAIGSKPNTQIFQSKLDLDKNGYIKINDNFKTSIKDVYAIGDIVDPVFKQAITAAGDGAKAAIICMKNIEEKTSITNDKKEESINDKVEMVNNFNNENVQVNKPTDQIVTSNVIEIKDMLQFQNEMDSKNTPIIIDFYATWCGPCKRLSPILENQAKLLQGKVKILKVNVENLQDLALKYQIKGMPTIVVFDKENNVLFKKMGVDDISSLLFSLEKSKDKPLNEIEEYLKKLE